MHPLYETCGELNFNQISDWKWREKDGTIEIFDRFRKKWVVLTPEEWVRQHAAISLNTDFGYPSSLIAVEKGLKVNGRPKRFDILLYQSNGQPKMLVECKSMDVQINQDVFDQIATYNRTLGVPYLLITNGLKHYCFKVDQEKESFVFLENIPLYNE